ncbi:MAG: hypothetical protein KUG77_03755 [Nannocystaceae bacterium]|nr:hypothetical protein [Nannocystaceae bacterium]
MNKSEFTITHGYVQDANTVRVVASIDRLKERGSTASGLHKYIVPTNEKVCFDLDWAAIASAVRVEPEFCGVALSLSGTALVSRMSGNTFLEIDIDSMRPEHHGPLRDLICTGEHFVAVGMGRQVYKLDVDQGWCSLDKGLPHAKGPGDICGFNSVCCDHQGTLYAVGFNGEIWVCVDDVWTELESPTPLVLNVVACGAENDIYVMGQMGTLLVKRGGSFVVVSNEDTSDILGGAVFLGDLFFCTATSLFRLTDGVVEEIETGIDDNTLLSVSCCSGRICVFGPKIVITSVDGVRWEEIPWFC